MIFVTVGTHEQPFNRLIECVDKLVENGDIKEDVVIQAGYSTYKPKHCKSFDLIPYQEMLDYVKKARIVITHGGPASFIMPLQFGKVPVVVPRRKKFNEHVNDHQAEFSKQVAERLKNIIVVEDIDRLGDTLKNYEKELQSLNISINSNNAEFNAKFKSVVNELFGQ